MPKKPSATKTKKRKAQDSALVDKQERRCRKIWDDIMKAREAGDEKRQEELLKACLVVCKNLEEWHSLRISTEIALASLYGSMGRLNETMPYLKSAVARIHTHHKQNYAFFTDTYLHASACYRSMGNNREAERLASAALKVIEEQKLKSCLAECHEALFLCRYTEACELMGARQYKKAQAVF